MAGRPGGDFVEEGGAADLPTALAIDDVSPAEPSSLTIMRLDAGDGGTKQRAQTSDVCR